MTEPIRTTILLEAARITGDGGQRASDYGPPVENHLHIAAIASAILARPVQPEEVAVILMAVKLARLAKSPKHRDSYVDLCGYAGILYEIAVSDDADPAAS